MLGWGSEESCSWTLQQKTQRTQCGSNPGPLDYESNTLHWTSQNPYRLQQIENIFLCLAILPCFIPFPNIKFRLFLTERISRQQFQFLRKWQAVLQVGRKHCGKKEKLLVIKDELDRFFLIQPFPRKSPDLYLSAVEVFWRHCGKRRNCSFQAISPLSSVFYQFEELSAIFFKFNTLPHMPILHSSK